MLRLSIAILLCVVADVWAEPCDSVVEGEVCYSILAEDGNAPDPDASTLRETHLVPTHIDGEGLECWEVSVNSELRCQLTLCDADSNAPKLFRVGFPKINKFENSDSQDLKIVTQGCKVITPAEGRYSVVYRYWKTDRIIAAYSKLEQSLAAFSATSPVGSVPIYSMLISNDAPKQYSSTQFIIDTLKPQPDEPGLSVNLVSIALLDSGEVLLELSTLLGELAKVEAIGAESQRVYKAAADQYQAYSLRGASVLYDIAALVANDHPPELLIESLVVQTTADEYRVSAVNAYVDSKAKAAAAIGEAIANVKPPVARALSKNQAITLNRREFEALAKPLY